MTKNAVLASLSADAKARPSLPKRELPERVSPRWPSYRKAHVYEGHPLSDTYDAHAHLAMERGNRVAPATLPQGFHDPRKPHDAEEWHKGSKPIEILPASFDRSLESRRVRPMKPKAKQKPRAKAVQGVVEWDVQYRPDLPPNWSEQARRRNWDCLSRHVDGRPTLKRAFELLTAWRLFDTRIIVAIDERKRTTEVWFKVPPVQATPKLGTIADDGISGRR